VRGEKILARLASGFVFLLAKPEFYSHLASWRVVFWTPVHVTFLTKIQSIVQDFIGFQPKLQKKLTKTQNRGAINLTRKAGLENNAVRLN
jgi:hypothetical protein